MSNLSGVIIKVSEIDAVNNKAVIRDGTVWKYAIDEREVAPEDISKIERKNGIEYLYTFLNKEDDIPDLPKDDDWPLGTWINASEVTSRESFEDIYKDSENESTVLVIVEDFKTNMAMATLEDGTTDSIRVSLDNVNINDVEKIVKEEQEKKAQQLAKQKEDEAKAKAEAKINEEKYIKDLKQKLGLQ
jgi:hypothetical protein